MSPMKMSRHMLPFSFLVAGALGIAPALSAQSKPPATAQSQAAAQQTFSTPEQAMQALIDAAQAKDRAALAKLFGPDYDELLSGDRVEDQNDPNNFAAAIQQSNQLQKDADDRGVELRARAALDLGDRLLVAERRPVGAVARHRVERVRDG